MLSTLEACFTQFGCGLCAPPRWLNFDASPAIRLQRLPIIGNLVPSGQFGRFPENVKYGSIVDNNQPKFNWVDRQEMRSETADSYISV